MKAFSYLAVLLLILIAVALLFPGTRDELHWQWASFRDQHQAYQQYLTSWPDTRHATEAKSRCDERCWSDATTASTLEGYRTYERVHPDGSHVTEARTRIDDLLWRHAKASNTIRSLQEYVQTLPQGRHAAEAQEDQEALRIDETIWQAVLRKDRIEAVKEFLKEYPGHTKEAEARTRLEDLTWRQATIANTVTSYQGYAQAYAEGRYLAEARQRQEALRRDEGLYEAALRTGSVEALDEFLRDYPGHVKEVEAQQARPEVSTWQQAKAARTILALQDYVRTYPEGRYLAEAQELQEALLTDESLYLTTLQQGTDEAVRHFITNNPGHAKLADAEQVLKDMSEPRDIVDLLDEEKIELQTQGSGIQNIEVKVRRVVPYPITVRIGVGTFFVSGNASSQNMVTTAECQVRLTSDGWHSVSPDAACANRPRDIPTSSDTFTPVRSPHQKELTDLMPVLVSNQADYGTRQAAVWIVTDDADYDDLGSLIQTRTDVPRGPRPLPQNPYGRFSPPQVPSAPVTESRVIREREAAHAMKICEEAGVDIKDKAIWGDRQRILSGLVDSEVKRWLQQKQ